MDDILVSIDEALERMRKKGYEDTDDYRNLEQKRHAIANGAKYRVKDVTPEVIAGLGGAIASLNHHWGGRFVSIDDAIRIGARVGNDYRENKGMWKLKTLKEMKDYASKHY